MKDVILNEEQVNAIKEALKSADALATSVISGKPGTMRAALDVARALDSLKRSSLLTHR